MENFKDFKDKEFAEALNKVIKYSAAEPMRLNRTMNLSLHDCSREEGYAEFNFEVKEWCRNPYGDVHGGATAAIFDASLGISAAALSGKRVTTTDMSVSYLRAMGGERYIFRGEFNQVGRRMIRCSGKAIDADTGKVCATAMASFMVLD